MGLLNVLMRCICGLEKIWSFVIFKLRNLLSQKINVLHLSDNFLVINKNHDIVINSNDPHVAVSVICFYKRLLEFTQDLFVT